MPLSKGYLGADQIRYGYHGMLFERGGACVEIPSQSGRPPATARIDAYTCVETGPLVWIWMGDPAEADASKIPDTGWLNDPAWAFAHGYVHVPSNYVGLHENLLDLSHFTYLHPGNIGTPEFAATPFEVSTREDYVRISRFVPDCPVPDIFTRPTGMAAHQRISRETVSEYLTPDMNTAYAILTNLSPGADARTQFEVRISHFITPESADTTHYFFSFARDFAVADEEVTRYIEKGAKIAFGQDVDALLAIRDIAAAESDRPFEEINLRSDQAGVAMRRILKRLSDQQTRHSA